MRHVLVGTSRGGGVGEGQIQAQDWAWLWIGPGKKAVFTSQLNVLAFPGDRRFDKARLFWRIVTRPLQASRLRLNRLGPVYLADGHKRRI